MTAKTVRIIFGDQLDLRHSWFDSVSDEVMYLVAELHQEAEYVKHHTQKICAFFLAMQEFANALSEQGHAVTHLSLDDSAEHQDFSELLASVCKKHGAENLQYQRPDEYRLSQQMSELEIDGVSISQVESEHFLLPFDEIENHFSAGKASRMEAFYRRMREQHDILMEDGDPTGGKWNYDAENRNKLKKSDLDDIPQPLVFENDVSDVLSRLERHKIETFGESTQTLPWPVNYSQAQQLLTFFCEQCLPKFGKFQDAMTRKSEFKWSLYHSRLSFAINAKILKPVEVIERAIEEYTQRKDEISLAQIEGFIRQILGWREFIRGMYWINMPEYRELNALEATRSLPDYFWTGETKMRCLQECLGQSLQHAYAHHIQRLMVIGNFCLLTGLSPDEVDAWYLGVYVDALEWVEMPNTRGMALFGDDGLIASKPYSASGSYINRMSDYCSGCDYKVKEKVGEDACPFNSLYWHFMHRHKEKFSQNPRIGMVYRNLEKMDSEVVDKTLARADWLLENLNSL
jgi:deoxyribodipyrimidine photolyase-related protein